MAPPVLVLDWIELIELSGILFGAALLIILLFLKKDKAPQSDRLDELRDALVQQGHPNIGFQYLASRQGRGKTPLIHAPMPSVLTRRNGSCTDCRYLP